MLYIKDDGTIRLTRGDTARLLIPIKNLVNDDEYTMESDDNLYFTVKRVQRTTNHSYRKYQLVRTSFISSRKIQKLFLLASISMMYS